MVVKVLALGAVIYLVYVLFFRVKRKDTTDSNSAKKDSQKSSETMVECKKCATFISANEALIKNGQYYCSQECLEARK